MLPPPYNGSVTTKSLIPSILLPPWTLFQVLLEHIQAWWHLLVASIGLSELLVFTTLYRLAYQFLLYREFRGLMLSICFLFCCTVEWMVTQSAPLIVSSGLPWVLVLVCIRVFSSTLVSCTCCPFYVRALGEKLSFIYLCIFLMPGTSTLHRCWTELNSSYSLSTTGPNLVLWQSVGTHQIFAAGPKLTPLATSAPSAPPHRVMFCGRIAKRRYMGPRELLFYALCGVCSHKTEKPK